MTQINYPMDVIASPNWKITTPLPNAPEIKYPALTAYTAEWFHLNATGDGAVFMARTDGGHTSGSKNPRSELREMSSDGKSNAAWSTTVGTHSMEIEQSVDVLPQGAKPHVVVGQIHNASDDVTVFRVEGRTDTRDIASIWITNGDTTHGYLITDNYHRGDKFRVGFKVSGGIIQYTFNGQPVNYALPKKTTGCYFKAGCYNQSGGIVTKLPDGQVDYAQVTIYAVQVCHDGVCTGNKPGDVVVEPPTPPAGADVQPLIDALNVVTVSIQDVIVKLTALKNQ